MGSRRKARILAVQALYGWDVDNKPLHDVLEMAWLDEELKAKYDDDTLAFARMTLKGTLDNIKEIDRVITKNIKRWDLDRLARVELAVLRVGVYSLMYQKDIPASVSIDEAIDIVKEYGNPESYRFINGVLDAVRTESEADSSK